MVSLVSCRVYVYGQGFDILMQSCAEVFQAASNTTTNWRALWGVWGAFIRIEEFAVVLYSSGKKALDKRLDTVIPAWSQNKRWTPALSVCVCASVCVSFTIIYRAIDSSIVLMKWHPKLHSVILQCVISLFISRRSLFSLFLTCFLPPICLSHLISAWLPLLLLLTFCCPQVNHVAYFVFILCQVCVCSVLFSR